MIIRLNGIFSVNKKSATFFTLLALLFCVNSLFSKKSIAFTNNTLTTLKYSSNPCIPSEIAIAGPNQIICSTSVTMAANSPTLGIGNWSLISGSGVISDPSLFSTEITGLSIGNNIFEWAISDGTCTSVSSVTITVDENPTPAFAGSNQTVCINSPTTILNANSPLIGVGTWSVISGSGIISSQNSETTSVTSLGLGQTVLEWKIVNGVCPSSASTVVIQTDQAPSVANAGTNKVACITSPSINLNANTPLFGTGSWSIVAGNGVISNVSSENASISGLTVGTTILEWSINANNGCAPSTSTVAILIDAEPSIADAGVNQNICITSPTVILNANTPTMGIGSWSVLSGNATITNSNIPNPLVTNLGIGNTVLLWSISNGVCIPSTSTVSILVNSAPSPAIAGSNQTICVSTPSTNLSANNPIVGIGTWSIISGSGTIINANNHNTSIYNLNPGVTILQWGISNGACSIQTSTISIQIDNIPTTASAGSNQTLCISNPSVSLLGNAPTVGVGTWSIITGSASISNSNAAVTSATSLSLGSTVFLWKIVNGSCAPSTSTVLATVNPLPSQAAAGSNKVICVNSASTTLGANNPAVGTGTWSILSGSGTLSAANSPNSVISNLGLGNTILQWSIGTIGCFPTTSTMSVQVDQLPTISNAGANQTLCITNPNTTITANAPLVGSASWSINQGSGSIVSNTSPTTAIAGLTVGTTILQWSIINGVCPPSSSTISIQVDNNSISSLAGPNQTICAATPSAIMAGNIASPGVGTWSVLSGGGTIVNPNSHTTIVTGIPNGTNVLQWKIINGSCSFASSVVYIYVIPSPGNPNAVSNQTLCVTNPTAIVSANSPSLGTASWSVVTGSATISSPLTATTNLSNIGVGNNVIAWTMNYSVCHLTSTINIHVDAIPSLANAGVNQTICANSPNATLSANTPTGGIGTWSFLSGSGNILSQNSANSIVTNLNPGINILKWTINGGACGTNSSTMSIQVDNVTTPATTNTIQSLCISSPSVILSGNSPSPGNGIWSLVSGNANIITPTLATSAVTNLGVGINILKWTITNGFCSSSSTLAIQVDDLPSPSNAGVNQFLCINSPSTTLNANLPSIGSGSWSLVSGSGTITNPNSENSTITGLNIGLTTLGWVIGNGACGSNTSTVSIQVDQPPSIATVSPNQTLCFTNTLVTISGNTPLIGNGVWSLASGNGAIVTPTLPITNISSIGTGTNIFNWTISNGGCTPSTASIQIVIDPPPTNSNAGANQLVCITNPNALMTANSPTIGVGSWSIVSGFGTIVNTNSENTAITNLSAGNNVFAWTISNNCASSTSNVTVTVNQVPTTAFASSNQTICVSNTVATISGNIPLYGNGLWTLLSGTGTISSPTANTTAITNLGIGNNIFGWTISNAPCLSSTSTVQIVVNPIPTNALAGSNQSICASNPTATMNANTPIIGSGLWTLISGSGSITNTNSPITTITNLGLGNNVFEWSIKNSCGLSTSQVTLTVNQLPSTASVSSNQTICINSPSTTVFGNVPLIGNGIWNLVSGMGTINTPNNYSTSITNLSVGANILSWQISNGGCLPSTATLQIDVDPMPTNALAGLNQTICVNSVALMSANSPTYGNGIWTLVSGNGLINTPNSPNTTLSNLAAGTNVFKWTISNNCASNSSTLAIFTDQLPSISNAGPDQNLCLANSFTLSANNPTIGNGSWSVITGNSNVNSPNSNTTTVTSLNIGINSFVWTIANGSCPKSSDTIKIINYALPSIANAGPDQFICLNTTTLSANMPAVGSGNWNIISGNATITNSLQNNSSVSNLSLSNNLLEWIITNGNCPISRDTVKITVLPPTPQAFAGNDTTIYSNDLTLHANNPITGSGNWTVVDGSCNIQNSNQYNTFIDGLKPGLLILKWTINDACGSSQDDIYINLNVDELPNAISPNGDGKNDYFEIPLITSYKKVELKIVNRWGSLVYEDKKYNNNWNGLNQSGGQLTEDTYFYVLNIDDVIKTGYITLKR